MKLSELPLSHRFIWQGFEWKPVHRNDCDAHLWDYAARQGCLLYKARLSPNDDKHWTAPILLNELELIFDLEPCPQYTRWKIQKPLVTATYWKNRRN